MLACPITAKHENKHTHTLVHNAFLRWEMIALGHKLYIRCLRRSKSICPLVLYSESRHTDNTKINKNPDSFFFPLRAAPSTNKHLVCQCLLESGVTDAKTCTLSLCDPMQATKQRTSGVLLLLDKSSVCDWAPGFKLQSASQQSS